ncbi:AI-2E family transporter [Novipirellula rosea]|uniref:Pheromone autoinducer 2 transporter n=1 Tax=Novipirellula rosea TaxID=1031540 RepID=A0ABP8MTY9_9BACT
MNESEKLTDNDNSHSLDRTSNIHASSTPLLVEQTWWQRPLIWGVFLVLLFVLREFFLIGFLTFLLCFMIRGVVGVLTRAMRRQRDDHRLDLILTLVVFFLICAAFFGLGRFFVPPLIREGKSLLAQLKDANAEQVQNTLLANTVGKWKFDSLYGTPDDSRYQTALREFQTAGRHGNGLYQEFPKLHSRLEAEFESNYEQTQVLQLRSDTTVAGTPLKQWFLETKAPELFHDKSDYYISRWRAKQASTQKPDELVKLSQSPDFESRRDEQIRQRIWTDVNADPVLLAQLTDQWGRAMSIQAWDNFRSSPQYKTQFKKFYETQFADAANHVPVDYAYFQTLAAAYPKGKPAFTAAVQQHDKTKPESAAHQQFDFESAKKLELGQQWWGTSHTVDWVRDHAAADGPKVLEAGVQRLDEGLGQVVRIPIQVGTALLLAVFMLIEWHGVKSGVAGIRNTRLRRVFDEVAPGIVALGKLMGKSFQGQVLIAFINACLTLLALWLIGVEYKFVLALLVFVFSFIPVVGVILSGFPICLIAILQPGGSLWMAMQVIVAIGIIHLIEGMILSPRIIGKIGHLHPVLVIVILLVAEHFFGMWGLILGVPVAIYLIRVVLLHSPIPGIYEPEPENTSAEVAP